jgi:ABC-type polysaccharide/polyol phosphate export permease
MYHLVRLYRIPIYYGRIPNLQEFLPGLVVALVVLVIGWVVFSRKADEFAYRI